MDWVKSALVRADFLDFQRVMEFGDKSRKSSDGWC